MHKNKLLSEENECANDLLRVLKRSGNLYKIPYEDRVLAEGYAEYIALVYAGGKATDKNKDGQDDGRSAQRQFDNIDKMDS